MQHSQYCNRHCGAWHIVYDGSDGKRYAVINGGFSTRKEADMRLADRVANGDAFPNEYVRYIAPEAWT